MQVWAVIHNPSKFSDQLYQDALTCVDPESQARIKRFYHRVDSCRTLIGRLLVRMVLKERGIHPDNMKFGVTPAGKPYIAEQAVDPPIAYNITHDNNLIAMAFGPGIQKPPAFSIGIDVMKINIPRRESFESFIEAVGDQLTEHEHSLLGPDVPAQERLRRFFWMWTLKEAYTKALGLGLGFNFKRVQFDVVDEAVLVDGITPQGWRFKMFVVEDQGDRYQGVVAEYLGGISTEIVGEGVENNWLKIDHAVPFTESAISLLKHS